MPGVKGTEPDEERLVRRTAKGDRAAFEELYRRTSPWLAVRLRRRCADEQIVAEVMQERFYLILRRTTAVLAVVLPAQAVVGWLSGAGAGLGLLPSLAFTTGTLAPGGLIGVTRAAYVLIGVWAAVIVLPAVAEQRQAVLLEPELLPVWGGIFVLTAVVVVLRRSAFGLLSGHER